MKRALITGISGQDGSYLAELLLAKDYHVWGMVRESSAHHANIEQIRSRLTLLDTDLLDTEAVEQVVRETAPDEIYHLAAPTFVPKSFQDPQGVLEFAERSVTNLIDAIRGVNPAIKLFHAASAEIFGSATESPQSETTPLHPRNPYGEAKALGHALTVQAREQYGLFAVSGILFNHESPRRSLQFVTRKIVCGAVDISLGLTDSLELGDLEARRDWGYAPEYVDAMWRMLQTKSPEDFVIATGQTHSVRDFCELAFGELDLDYRQFVKVNPEFIRPREEHQLVGNPAKAKRLLDWEARMPFPDMVKLMVRAEMQASLDQSG